MSIYVVESKFIRGYRSLEAAKASIETTWAFNGQEWVSPQEDLIHTFDNEIEGEDAVFCIIYFEGDFHQGVRKTLDEIAAIIKKAQRHKLVGFIIRSITIE